MYRIYTFNAPIVSREPFLKWRFINAYLSSLVFRSGLDDSQSNTLILFSVNHKP